MAYFIVYAIAPAAAIVRTFLPDVYKISETHFLPGAISSYVRLLNSLSIFNLSILFFKSASDIVRLFLTAAFRADTSFLLSKEFECFFFTLEDCISDLRTPHFIPFIP